MSRTGDSRVKNTDKGLLIAAPERLNFGAGV